MSYDRQEFLDSVSKRAQSRTADNMPFLRAAAAVAPVMEKLTTGSEHWDRYLSYLSGFIKQAESFKANAQAKLSDPLTWDSATLIKLKADILMADSAIQAWVSAMELPKALMANGDEAVKVISRFEEANAPEKTDA